MNKFAHILFLLTILNSVYIQAETLRNGQPIFQQGKKYFSPDRDQHSGGTWKRADSPKALESKATRNGTYDVNLNQIGD